LQIQAILGLFALFLNAESIALFAMLPMITFRSINTDIRRSKNSIERQNGMKNDVMDQRTEEAPQDECDKRGPGYDNNTRKGWLTGKVQATKMPNYDNSKKWK